MKNILLSIIIPCRNGANWIHSVAESIYRSDLNKEEFEIVFVDDASEDDTYAQMQVVASSHDNVNVLKLPTRFFLGGARNQGLNAAKGEYVWFIDADDFISNEGCTKALHFALDNSLDVLGFEYSTVDYRGELIVENKVFKDYSIQDGISFAKKSFYGSISLHMGFVWRFLYRRKFLIEQNIKFAEGVCWEDTVFMPKAIIEAKQVGAREERLYNYRQNPTGISGTMHRQYPAQLIYEFAIVAGKELLDYSLTVRDTQLKLELYSSAINKYLNGFLILLLRTNSFERKKFYQLVDDNTKIINEIKPYMNFKSKFILSTVGRWVVNTMSSIYHYKHN